MGEIINNPIRAELTRIVNDPIIPTSFQRADKICSQSLTIQRIPYSPPPKHSHRTEDDFLDQINCHCYCYSLGLWKEDIWDTLLYHRVLTDNNLIDGHYVEDFLSRFVEHKPPTQDDLVVYYDLSGNITHTGIYKIGPNNLIESKWGNLPVFTHQESEVPDNYGVTTKYFKLPSSAEIKKFFDQYCEDIGI